MKSRIVLIFLIIIIALAGFLRLWQLDSIPPGVYPDEAIHGNEAWQALNTGKYKIFYPDNNGREGLWVNMIAQVFRFLDPSPFSLRILSAIFGILTVWGVYLLARELFRYLDFEKKVSSRWIALFASFFTAISFWHINFSRIAFRGIMVPLLMVWGFYFLLEAFRRKNVWDFLWSGVILGLGFHTYIAFRFVPLVLLVYLLLFMWKYWRENKEQLKKLSAFQIWKKIYIKDKLWQPDFWFLILFLVALPIGIFFLQNPDDFLGRAAGVSIFAQDNPLRAFGQSWLKTLGMFNFQGDFNWRHNFSGAPQLFLPVGILFVFGFLISLKELFRSFPAKDFARLIPHKLLITWFIVLLLPATLTAEGLPHALRAIGVIPVVYIFAGLGLAFFLAWLMKDLSPGGKGIVVIVLLLFFGWSAYQSFNKYFVKWTGNENTKAAFTKRFVKIGEVLNKEPENVQRFVIVNEGGVLVDDIPMPAQTVMFATIDDPEVLYLLPENIDKITKAKGKKIVIPMSPDRELLGKINLDIDKKEGILIGR